MSVIVYESELYHHGILGQKWGVRRYQNKDGTLTKRGQKHYTKVLKKEIKNQKKELKKSLKKDAKKEAKKLSFEEEMSKMTNQEMQTKISREKLEKRYNDLFAPDNVSKGQKKVQDLLESTGSLLTVTGKAVSVGYDANQIFNFTGKKVTKKNGGKGNKGNNKKNKSENPFNSEEFKKSIDETKKSIEKVEKMNKESMDNKRKHKPRLDLSGYSDKELKDKIEREQIEREYSKMFNTKVVKSGHDKVMDALAIAGSALTVAGTAISIKKAFDKMSEK